MYMYIYLYLRRKESCSKLSHHLITLLDHFIIIKDNISIFKTKVYEYNYISNDCSYINMLLGLNSSYIKFHKHFCYHRHPKQLRCQREFDSVINKLFKH